MTQTTKKRSTTLITIVAVVVTYIGFRIFVGDTAWVPSGSMHPSLVEGDLLYINRLASDIHRCDVVVFNAPASNTRMVKRVIAIPGDQVELVDGVLVVNDRRVDRRVIAATEDVSTIEEAGLCSHPLKVQEQPQLPRHRSAPARTLGPSEYFVMGDARDDSVDSRDFGTITTEAIVGRVDRVLVSLDLERYFAPRGNRLFVEVS